jgi:hypothetical protein
MSDGLAKRERLRVIEVAAIAASILGFSGFTLFRPRVISDVIVGGEIPPVNETLVVVTVLLGLARISFLLAYLFADPGFVQALRCRSALRAAQSALLAILPSPAVLYSLLISTLVLFAFFLGVLTDRRYGQPDNARSHVAERWPAQALPTYDLAWLEKLRAANPGIVPVTYERPSESQPTAQLFADVEQSSKQKMDSLVRSIEDLLGDRKLFVRIVEIKDRKRSRRFYRMLAGPFESKSDVIRFCRAYNRRFNLHGRAACAPESVSLEIRTDNQPHYRRSTPHPRAPDERMPEPRGLDFIFPRLFHIDNVI